LGFWIFDISDLRFQISDFSITYVTKNDELAEKTSRLQRMLEREQLGGVIISGQPNFAWLSCGGSNGVDTSREPGVASLLVRSDGRRFVLANRIEMPRMLAEEVSADDFEPVEFAWEEEKADPDFLIRRVQSLLSDNQTVASDIPVGSCETIEPSIADCRYELTPAERERFKKLGADAGRAIADVARRVEPGETEKEIARRACDALAAANIRPVVMLVAADDRIQKFRHPVPTDLSWKNALMIVVCARRAGLIASLTRIVTSGAVPDKLRSRTIAAATVNANLLAATKPGALGAALYQVVARSYAEVDFPDEEKLHHQGGACGYRTRDWVAHPASTDVVQDHQAFAWNPSITGTKVEETVIVSGERIETITSTCDWPQISINLNGKEYRSPDVLPL
jgi:Xaa-Pro aminopeptidase